jgi:hypothetical protein
MELRIALLKNVHLLNTTTWVLTLHREGFLPEALELIEKINATRRPLASCLGGPLSKKMAPQRLRGR